MTVKNMKLFPWLLVFYEVLIYLSMDAYVPALPELTRVFHISGNMAQFTFSIWILGGVLLQLVVGPLTDRYGRRPLLLFSGVLYIVSCFACGLSSNIHTLLIARFFQGMALPMMYTAGYAAVNEVFDSQGAIKILARMQMLTKLVPAFAPLLGGAFLMVANWRWIFIIIGILSIFAVLALAYKMPETLVPEKRLKRLHLGSILQQYRSVLCNGKFLILACLTYIPTLGLIAWMITGPFIIVHTFHMTTLAFGVMQAIIFAAFLIGTQVVHKYSAPTRNRFLVNMALVCIITASFAAAIFEGIFPMHLYWLVFFMVVICFGAGIAAPILARLTLESSDQPMGMKVSVFSFMRMGSGFIGSIVVALFYEHSIFSLALILSAFAVIVLLIRLLSFPVAKVME